MANSRDYKFTVRFNADEVQQLRKAAGDTQLTRYIRLAALREASHKNAAEKVDEQTPPTGIGFANSPPFGGEIK